MKNTKGLKTVVITGAGSGLGRELAQKFYESNNFNVCLIGREEKKLKETVKDFRPERQLILACDIRNYKEVQKVFTEIKKTYGSIDLLVNNAGIFEMLTIDETSEEVWGNIMKTNAFGTFYCTKETIKIMPKSNKVRKIVNILSIITEKDLPFNSAYAASKYAIMGMMNSLREELKGKNIYITNISPGIIDTGIWNKKNKLRGQSPKEIADIIYYLSTQSTTYAESVSLLPIN
ncbi:MAG: SDR family oxidoreductase [bacterium]